MHPHREAAGAGAEPCAQHLAAYPVMPQTTEGRKSTWESLFVFAWQLFDFEMISALRQLCALERPCTLIPTNEETETWSDLPAHVQQN